MSRVTNGVVDEPAAGQAGPLEAVYPIVYGDGLAVKVRSSPERRSL